MPIGDGAECLGAKATLLTTYLLPALPPDQFNSY